MFRYKVSNCKITVFLFLLSFAKNDIYFIVLLWSKSQNLVLKQKYGLLKIIFLFYDFVKTFNKSKKKKLKIPNPNFKRFNKIIELLSKFKLTFIIKNT